MLVCSCLNMLGVVEGISLTYSANNFGDTVSAKKVPLLVFASYLFSSDAF